LGLFASLFGWKKLLDIEIRFGDGGCVSVKCRTGGIDVPGTEYIRLWLQFTANVAYLLGQVSPELPEELIGAIEILVQEPINADTKIFPVLTEHGVLRYSDEIEDTELSVKGRYYTKGSVFRMIKIGIKKPEILVNSVPAVYQFAINRIAGHRDLRKRVL